MNEGLITTAAIREDDGEDGTSAHSVPTNDESASLPLHLPESKEVVVNPVPPIEPSTSGDNESKLTSDIISSNFVAPTLDASVPDLEEPILAVDSDDSGMALPPVAEQPIPPSVRTAQRLQRQLNAQLLATRSQLGSISTKVEEMISSEDQCNVAPPDASSRAHPEGALEVDECFTRAVAADEGFCDGGEDEEELEMERIRLTFRKAGDNPGIRKVVNGTEVTFAPPRMRKRIMRRRHGNRPAV